MIQAGERIKIKTEAGDKLWGFVVAVSSRTDQVDVTIAGLFPGGPPPDDHRKFMPGRTSVTLTVEIEGPR